MTGTAASAHIEIELGVGCLSGSFGKRETCPTGSDSQVHTPQENPAAPRPRDRARNARSTVPSLKVPKSPSLGCFEDATEECGGLEATVTVSPSANYLLASDHG